MNRGTSHAVIPEGELGCIWMDAGLIAFKLCDQKYRCESCRFDAVVRKEHEREIAEARVSSGETSIGEPASTASGGHEQYFKRQLELFVKPLKKAELPSGRRYFRNHTWAKAENGGLIVVGIDHLAIHMLGVITSIVLPKTPFVIREDSPCSWLIHREGTFTVRSPLAGTATEFNEGLRSDPSLVVRSTYEKGWILGMAAESKTAAVANGLQPVEATAFYREQGAQLQQEILDAYRETSRRVGKTMADGGERIPGIIEVIGSDVYYSIVERLLRPL